MTVRKKTTQAQRVLDYMMEHGSITQLEAMNEIGVMRLASRISDLRKIGWPIEGKTEAVKNRYDETCHVKRYSLKVSDNDGNDSFTASRAEVPV